MTRRGRTKDTLSVTINKEILKKFNKIYKGANSYTLRGNKIWHINMEITPYTVRM